MAEDLAARVRRLEGTLERLLRTAEISTGAIAWTSLSGRPAALTSDPNADRGIFWDDSASQLAHFAPVAPISFSGTNLQIAAASTGSAGAARLATLAEHTTGTSQALAATPAGVQQQVDAGVTAQLPPGVIVSSALAAAPAGWLLCDGAAVSRTTYAALFAAIGTTYGAGNGSTTFNVPNLKGRVPVGIDTAQTEFDVRGETGGSKTHTLSIDQLPGTIPYFGPSGGNLGAAGSYNTRANTSQTHSQPHNNLQPYMALHYLIRT